MKQITLTDVFERMNTFLQVTDANYASGYLSVALARLISEPTPERAQQMFENLEQQIAISTRRRQEYQDRLDRLEKEYFSIT